jgi:CBS domain containing-hemolysin-like protein
MLIVRSNPEQVLDVLLPVFHPVARLLRPITATILSLMEREANGATTPDDSSQTPAADAEAKEAAMSEEEGRELLQSIVDFTETVVKEVMTPRPDIVAIRLDASPGDLRTLFREEQYSRIPVYRDNQDNIVGIVFVKDLVALPPTAEPPMTTLMRSAYFVPESKRVSELLKDMQRRQAQLAVVVDEYGGTAGLVTVEDLLEEIVGEIRDEYDVESETVTDEGGGVFVFSGKVNVDEGSNFRGSIKLSPKPTSASHSFSNSTIIAKWSNSSPQPPLPLFTRAEIILTLKPIFLRRK